MGVLPKLKRRCFGPGIVSLAAILSALLVYSFLFARPSYLLRPERLPPFESNEDKSPSLAETTDKPFNSDESYGLVHTPENGSPPEHTDTVGDAGKDANSDQPVDLGAEKDAPLVVTSSTTHTTSAPPAATSIVSEITGVASNGTVDAHVESSKVASSPYPTATATTNSSTPADKDAWEFNSTQDSKAYGLTPEQCSIAFPGLFKEIERAVAARKDLGRVTPEDIDITNREKGMIQALILDQQLYILKETVLANEYDSSRALAILHAIHRAIITSPEPLPDTEFAFSVADIVEDPEELRRPTWGLARKEKEEEIWLMSDFGYWSWPLDLVGGYDEIRREISDAEIDFAAKKKQAVWRGALATNEHRPELIRATEGKEWADVKAISWAGVSELTPEDQGKAISMPQHCQYQFVIHTEGHSYSGRGKYLQNCNSVVIMHKRTWIESHHSLLVAEGPNQNFVEVEEDFSDLEEKVVGLLADPARAEQISLNGVHTFRDRYLTPAAQACYWRELIKGWAGVSFAPAAWEDNGEDERRIRGVPFETFVIQVASPQVTPKCKWLGRLLSQC